MDIAIVGAGLAGLAAAVELHESGQAVEVYEASDRIGGRVATDELDGHLLDRGFQVMLSAYPDAATLLDLDDLAMCWFDPGAMVRIGGAFHRVDDPLQDPGRALSTLRAPIGSLADKLRIVAFRRSVRRGPVEAIWDRPETTARERLEAAGFSSAMIERFLRPLFAGITLDPDLGGSSHVLEFVFRMLSGGPAGVPAAGMAALPAQLARRLPDDVIRLSAPVESVSAGTVTLAGGEVIDADTVVVATDRAAAAELCHLDDPGWRATTTVWFAAEEPPLTDPVLVLNGAGTKPVNSLAVMSAVAPGYAPAGSSTIAVSAPLIDEGLVAAMKAELRNWFGPAVDSWRILRVDEIPRAHPANPVGTPHCGVLSVDDRGRSTGDDHTGAGTVLVCGDHVSDPSINGAIASGRAAARAAMARLATS